TLVLLLLSSLTTEAIGIHALFGAFLIGCIIPKANGFAQLLADKLEDLVVVFLLPLFFAFSGLRTQIGLLDSASAWWMCSLIIGVACLGKFGGSTVAARLTGLRWQVPSSARRTTRSVSTRCASSLPTTAPPSCSRSARRRTTRPRWGRFSSAPAPSASRCGRSPSCRRSRPPTSATSQR